MVRSVAARRSYVMMFPLSAWHCQAAGVITKDVAKAARVSTVSTFVIYPGLIIIVIGILANI